MENLTIGDLFCRRIPFVVEKYQRDYAWDSTEIEDFIKDIQKLYDTYDSQNKKSRVKEDPKRKRHFFGGLVSIEKQVSHTATGRVFEIVDGQQRLATFMISISLIVKTLNTISIIADQNGNRPIKKRAKNNADQADETLIHYTEIEGDEKVQHLRLKLSDPDKIFFEDLINGGTPTPDRDSHHRITFAYNEIKTKLIEKVISDNAFSEDTKMKSLLKLLSCLIDNCHVIHIISDDKKDAYRLFTVLNDRGRALSEGDLLRSFTLELLESNQKLQGQVESNWNEILSIEKEKIDTYLRNYYASNVGTRAAKRDLNDQYQSTFFQFTADLTPQNQIEIQKRVENMLIEFRYHKHLVDGIWPYEKGKISEWDKNRLELLINVLKHTLSIPLLLSARSKLTEIEFSNIVNLIERASFRYINIVGAHPGKLEKIYLKCASEIRKDPKKYKISNLEKDLHDLMILDAPDALFESNIVELKYAKKASQQNRMIKYFLTTIDDHYLWNTSGAHGTLKPEKIQPYDLDETSIEHIHAQKPQQSNRTLDPLVNDIGNLTLWAPSDNTTAGNSPFSQKKEKYRVSKIHLTKELSKLHNWTKKSLEKRRKSLVNMAIKIYSI